MLCSATIFSAATPPYLKSTFQIEKLPTIGTLPGSKLPTATAKTSHSSSVMPRTPVAFGKVVMRLDVWVEGCTMCSSGALMVVTRIEELCVRARFSSQVPFGNWYTVDTLAAAAAVDATKAEKRVRRYIVGFGVEMWMLVGLFTVC
jgi:hypothetical protein